MSKEGYYSTKDKDLEKRMKKNKIFHKDVKEDFIKSSGPGGQNVNKVSTCVSLVHIPTGIKVKCQKERTQKANRHKAWVMLIDKIEKDRIEKEAVEKYAFAKKNRQNRKRPDIVKEKMLEEKHKKSEKKQSRKKIDIVNLDQLL